MKVQGTTQGLLILTAVALLAGAVACTSSGAKKAPATSSTTNTASTPTTSSTAARTSTTAPLPTDLRVHQHVYKKGEVFTFKYEATQSTYATTPSQGGKVPRVKALQTVNEVRATVRFSVVASGAKLKKRIELIDPQFRDLTPADLRASAAPVAYRPLSAKLPGFPTDTAYTYPIGQDAQVALHLNDVFKNHLDPFVYNYIDIFTFPASVTSVPTNLRPGGGYTMPGVDVPLGGVTFHSATQYILYDRVDELDGVPQAYFENQGPGSYVDVASSDSNVLQTFHVPLTGPYEGLVVGGELQEVNFATATAGITSTVRQVSMTLQTPTTTTSAAGN